MIMLMGAYQGNAHDMLLSSSNHLKYFEREVSREFAQISVRHCGSFE